MQTGPYNHLKMKRDMASLFSLSKALMLMLLLSVACPLSSQATHSSHQKVTLSAKNVSLEEVLTMLKKQSGYTFFYDHALIKNAKKVDVDIKNMSLEQALDACLADQSITYKIVGKTVVLKFARKNKETLPQTLEQPGKETAALRIENANLSTIQLSTIQRQLFETVRGRVTDETGAGLPGVNILVKGTSQGTISDADGQFTLNVNDLNAVLVFSFVGYVPQEVVIGGRTTINVSMAVDNKALEEVVVTALGIRREAKALGYSVTKVEGEAFTKTRETNIMNGLVGKVAGVNVVAGNSGASGSSRVTIRGNTSITGNNQPLYIINGMPMDNSQFGQPNGRTPDWGDNVSSLNADDIEEMTVLKGATAAALYGSRAKNGAIIITTKSGRGSKGLGVEVNTNNTWEVPLFLWEIQDQYGQGYGGFRPVDGEDAAKHSQNHWGERYDGRMTYQYDGVQRPYSYVKDQVLKDFYRNGFTSSNNVSFTGGGDNGSFRLGISDMRNQGIVPNNSMRRNNISFGFNQTLGKNLTINANVDYVNEHVKNRLILDTGQGAATNTILYVNSNMPTSALSPGYDENGNEWVLGTDRNATNPYFVINRVKNSSNKDRFISTLTARWNIFDWLFIQGRAGQDYYSFRANQILPDGIGFLPTGQINETTSTFSERNFEGLIGIDKELSSDFSLSVNLGGNMMSQHRYSTGVEGLGFVIPQFHVINNTSVRNVSTSEYNKKINSLFGTAELGFRNHVFLNITGRNDWFSTLNPKSNSYFYPSVGLSYVFSEAMELPRAISFGKLRVAYASVGGDTDPYMLNLTYNLLPYSYAGTPLGTISQSTIPNANLKPLAVNELEAGLDVRLFNNRLGVDFSAYNKVSNDDIAFETISSTSGYSGAVVNVGSIRNRGIELLITGNPIRKNDFSWDISLNAAYNKSKVLKISETSDEFSMATGTKATIRHIVGMEYAQIVGRKILQNEQGQDVINSQGVPIVTSYVVPFGSGVHRWTTGLTNNFTYKGFTLSAQIDGKFGGRMYSETNYSLEHRGMSWGSLLGRDGGIVLPGVTETGEPNTVHISQERVENRAIIIARREALDDYLYDTSFIRFRYASLTYNLPKSIYEQLGFVKGASISFIGRNLGLLLSRTPGLDPESQLYTDNKQGIEKTTLPPVRSWGFNVNLKF